MAAGGGAGSALFSGYRALGLYSNHLPHALRYHEKHREFYVTTAVGNRFHTYNVGKLGITAVSNSLAEDISCLAADRMLVFAAAGQEISAFARNKEVVHVYRGHTAEVRFLLPLGNHLISAAVDGTLIVWDVEAEEDYLRLTFDQVTFELSAMLHPSTYLNKVLLGSTQGVLQLWNIKTNKLLYTFSGWSAGVTVLTQSPAVDVVGVGLSSGKVIIHNIRLDKSLMTFTQDWGPVTTLAFRTDGPPIMAAGSPQGHIAFWDLERQQLASQQRHAHSGAVAAATFLHQQPLLITNASDNSIKVWIFDQSGGEARLLRSRQGHSAPPTYIRHHGNHGHDILSAGHDGTLQSFSCIHERFNKNLGRECARESDWDGIVACHRGHLVVTTWNYQRCTMGAHRLQPPRSQRDRALDVYATAVDITSCGNFAVVGLSSGHADVYNIQSGLHRGQYGDDAAHRGAVRGVAVDGLNQLTVTMGSDQHLRLWRFKSRQPVYDLELSAPPDRLRLHRDSGMLAIAMDDLTLNVFDLETRRVVRKFSGHWRKINDMAFSPDGRWLVTVAMDCTIRTWDVPTGCLVDCFQVDMAAVGLSFSPTGDFLATTHVNCLGVYLWSNKSLCNLVSLRPLPANYEPTTSVLPSSCPGQDEERLEEDTGANVDEYSSPEQLDSNLMTLSLLPESRWKNLLNLEIIKRRNKPKEPPRVPETAPFFLPTVAGLTPSFAHPETPLAETESKVVNFGVLAQKSKFYQTLESNSFEESCRLLREFSPSMVDIELRGLAPEAGGSSAILLAFLCMIDNMLTNRRDYDLAQAYLALFLKLHLRQLSADAIAVNALLRLLAQLEEGWAELQTAFHQSLCLLAYTKSALL
ncbi:WD repeat-containing protein 36 isoform X2 [Lampris incognitus]|uniref:WD repeat-containing protein 36 isoform X2 n=1 Tax=Lampris incognitus TaxID=2546036 RepID=UPI0024B4AA2B|nr:WD repeat-containing protein 36 isoform X2 [Lampris incognitus]